MRSVPNEDRILMKIKFEKGLAKNQDLYIKATTMIANAELGLIRPKRLTCNKALVLNINLRIRAIKMHSKVYWQVMTHESYNRLSKNGHRR